MTTPDGKEAVEPSMTLRNGAAVRAMFGLYKDAWRQGRMPLLPRGLLVWAPGAVAEIGGHVVAVDPHDVADEPYFLDIEARYYWAAIPDWRIGDLRVVAEGREVMSFARFDGTARDGTVLDPIWLADRWSFDDDGRIARWHQITDLAAWGRWNAMNPIGDYAAYVAAAFADMGAAPRFVP